MNAIVTFFRGFGFYVITLSFLYGVFFSNKRSLLFSALVLLTVIFNIFLKKTLSLVMGDKIYPIIGSGVRPYKSNYCPKFGTFDNNKSFGMPSGHSQVFAFVSGLIIYYLFRINDGNKIIKSLALFSLSLIAMYIRVYIDNCHTIEQVLVGFLIGKLSAIIINKNHCNPFLVKF